jgi:hypothetical protein
MLRGRAKRFGTLKFSIKDFVYYIIFHLALQMQRCAIYLIVVAALLSRTALCLSLCTVNPY